MNMKVVSMCLICAGALLTGCGNGGKKEAETSERKEKEAVVGSDKDEHGCIASAGYTWSEVQKDCIHLWEKGVRMNAVDDAGKTLFLVFSPDSTQVELFFSEEGVSNEILDRRGRLPVDMPGMWKMMIRKTYVWKTVSGRSANGGGSFIRKMRMVNNIRIWKI